MAARHVSLLASSVMAGVLTLGMAGIVSAHGGVARHEGPALGGGHGMMGGQGMGGGHGMRGHGMMGGQGMGGGHGMMGGQGMMDLDLDQLTELQAQMASIHEQMLDLHNEAADPDRSSESAVDADGDAPAEETEVAEETDG